MSQQGCSPTSQQLGTTSMVSNLCLCICQNEKLPDIALEVHIALVKGAFVGRRADGHHNGVSPDMLLEQTYNADVNEESGLDVSLLMLLLEPNGFTQSLLLQPYLPS